MATSRQLREQIAAGRWDAALAALYGGSEEVLSRQRSRYGAALEQFELYYGPGQVGIAIPFCHLYIAFGVANPNISCRSFTERPAFCLRFTIFLPVPVMSIVGTLHIILPS